MLNLNNCVKFILTAYLLCVSLCLICSDPSNKKSVSAIERSICVLCLDKAMPRTYEKYSRFEPVQVLHGGGTQWNSANRWFDKSLQVREVKPNH